MLYTVLNEKRANNSLFQHIVADTVHYCSLSLPYFINQRQNNTSYVLSLSKNDKESMFIFRSCPFFILALVWCFGSKIVPRLLLGILTMINVWLLARWSDNFHFWYPIDIFTVYFLVWQFSYLMFQWCYHQLSWPFLIFYQASLCILIAIEAFIMYDLVFRYFSTINLVVIWFVCFYDVFACLHIHGRLRNMMNNSSMKYLMPTYPKFPVFHFYSHDIEDGIDMKDCSALAYGDFLMYNLVLLWLLSPLTSTTIQILILFGFTINIQIGLILTDWIGYHWKVRLVPGYPLPVIFGSAYALIIDFILKSLNIDNVNTLDCL
ncbi:hypothetical protein I4U23_025420 [Adineta vaga]|nr:hypothetical protein I4U23_025420 [Adineta vaga]